jgi:hypothetical protein
MRNNEEPGLMLFLQQMPVPKMNQQCQPSVTSGAPNKMQKTVDPPDLANGVSRPF